MTQLLRSLKTEVVHKPGCTRSGQDCHPWHWATTRTIEEVSATTGPMSWLHLCRYCLPGLCKCAKCTS